MGLFSFIREASEKLFKSKDAEAAAAEVARAPGDEGAKANEGVIMKAVAIAIVSALVLTACASSGVIPTDKDTYMISKQSAAGAFGTAQGVKGDIYVEANEFCGKQNKSVETVNVEAKNAIPFARQGSASLTFRCVPK
jgi:hypothetical protein